MRKMLVLLMYMMFSGWGLNSVKAQGPAISIHQPDSSKKIIFAEAACGECQFHMKGSGCHLAVRMNGIPYFVDGTKIDDHGDAHATNGFCNAIRRAEVQGEIKGGRFVATYFKLLAE